ncbi:UNVERIFIED_CONTAM: hypothetical protein FKN15_019922 [Acipenser sinensis]
MPNYYLYPRLTAGNPSADLGNGGWNTRPLKRAPAKPSFFTLQIHSNATRPIVLEDNTDLAAPLQNHSLCISVLACIPFPGSSTESEETPGHNCSFATHALCLACWLYPNPTLTLPGLGSSPCSGLLNISLPQVPAGSPIVLEILSIPNAKCFPVLQPYSPAGSPTVLEILSIPNAKQRGLFPILSVFQFSNHTRERLFPHG